MNDDENYGVSSRKKAGEALPPPLPYLPPKPKAYHPAIGIIGTGEISNFHLGAYKRMGFRVTGLCNRSIEKAKIKQAKFFPDSVAYSSHEDLLANDEIEVVDVTPHPHDRLPLIEAALKAGKHVLSQKPFVTDLADGQRLVNLAKSVDRKLAVNQNGRWAPHFRYITQAIEADLIGDVTTIDFSLQWDQTWITGIEAFESIHHMVLYDFAIHWFDITSKIMAGRRPERVFASIRKFEGQKYRPPALAHVVIDYDGAQVRMGFNAHNTFGEEDGVSVAGTKGLIRSRGPRLTEQTVTLYNENGIASPQLQGDWFTNGFEGTMGELLCAIEENREPENSAKNNLSSLQLCFAAIQSADTGVPVDPSTVTKL